MTDIWLNNDMDLLLTEEGDIIVSENIAQAIKVRLLWILGEWRLGPSIGFPWFEEVFVKRPDIEEIEVAIRDTILEVDGVMDCEVNLLNFDVAKRKISFEYKANTIDGLISEEVELDG